jgi:hypothetical protein
MALGDAMHLDVTEVAQLVHDLIGAGILTLREGQAAPRRNPTPPAVASMPTVQAPRETLSSDPPHVIPVAGRETPRDLWIPSGTHTALTGPLADHDEDSLFDPIAHGVLTAEGLPLDETTWRSTPLPGEPVAHAPVEPSIGGGEPQPGTVVATDEGIARTLCQQGDDMARAGDLVGAMAHWNAALRAPDPLPNAERVREAVALAARLHALLFP